VTYSQLRAFHALALEKSLLRAAEKLYLTQPAVSIQIRNLEQDCARTLFRRCGNSVGLTEDGLALFELSCQMFEAEERAKQLFSQSDQRLRTIHLGADGPHVALDLIAAVSKDNPQINFKVTLANADTTKDSLLGLKVDAAVMANANVDSRVITQPICRQSLMALIPVKHPLSDRKLVSMSELASYPLIFRENGSNTQRIVDQAFLSRNITPIVMLVMGSREGVKEAVARGLGIGFVFDRESSQDLRCVAIKVQELGGSNNDMLYCLKFQQQNLLVKILFDVAKQLSQQCL